MRGAHSIFVTRGGASTITKRPAMDEQPDAYSTQLLVRNSPVERIVKGCLRVPQVLGRLMTHCHSLFKGTASYVHV